jgi:cytochrome c-type biogenesis protein CcmH/NrfG
MQKGHYSTALKCFKRAARIRPDSIETLCNIGQIFQKRAAITTKNLCNTTIRH